MRKWWMTIGIAKTPTEKTTKTSSTQRTLMAMKILTVTNTQAAETQILIMKKYTILKMAKPYQKIKN